MTILALALGAIVGMWILRYLWLMLAGDKPQQGKPQQWGKQSDSISFTGKRFQGR